MNAIRKNIAAYTEATGEPYPAYLSINREVDQRITLSARERGHDGAKLVQVEVEESALIGLARDILKNSSAENGPRFVDNGDGTVTDARLGLMWSKSTLTEEEVDHDQATKLCADLSLAGHTDWRLPTIDELFALADRSKSAPAIDTEAFPDTQSDWYWTSTITAWAPSCAWIVSFSGGYAYDLHRGYYNAFVRAVRSLPAGQ